VAESDSRNAGRGRIAAKVADAQRPQIAGSIGTPVTAPLLSRAIPKLETPTTSRPVLKAVPKAGEVAEQGLRASKGEARTPNPQLKVLPQTAVKPPVPLAVSVGKAIAQPVPLRPSLQMAPLVAAPLSVPQFGPAYSSHTLTPSAGDYSYDPQITLPEHRFLTPSEL
jgi:hypothetical protein